LLILRIKTLLRQRRNIPVKTDCSICIEIQAEINGVLAYAEDGPEILEHVDFDSLL
jgi:hypothetical protein